MDYTGQIFRETESQIADLSATEAGGYTIVTISVGGIVAIKFPLPAGADAHEIALRAGNVINQTGLAPSNCRVDVQLV